MNMRSLRTSLIIYFLLLIGLPLILVVWRFSSTFHSETDKFVRQHTANILMQTEKSIDSLIGRAQKITDYNNDIFKKRTLPLPSKEMISREAFVHYSVRELLKTSIFNADMVRNVGVVNCCEESILDISLIVMHNHGCEIERMDKKALKAMEE